MPQNQPPPLSPQPLRPASPAPPPADRALQQRAWAAVTLALISLFGMGLMDAPIQRGVYVLGITVVIAAAALWLAVTSIGRARRIGSGRPRGAVPAIVLGSIGVLFGGIALVGFAVLWPQATQLSRCAATADTYTSQNACLQQFRDAVYAKFHLETGQPKP